MRAARVVAADTRLRRAAQVERLRELVRVRSRRRVDDRVRAADGVELLVAPVGALRPFVGAVAHLDRLLRDRLAGVRRVEDELDHLPVALVRVVEVVERVEEPVLERELPRVAGIPGEVGVDRRFAPCGEPSAPALVVASGIERVAGEVEVVLVPVAEIRRLRPDLDEVGAVPRPPQRDGRITEEDVDVEWVVGAPRAALHRLLHEPHDRRELLGERGLVGEIGGGQRGEEEPHGCSNEQSGPTRPAAHGTYLRARTGILARVYGGFPRGRRGRRWRGPQTGFDHTAR